MERRPCLPGGPPTEPRVLYDPALVEDVVRLEIERRRRAGDGRLLAAYRRGAEPLYALPLAERDGAFTALHARLFAALGVDREVRAALGRHAGALAGVPSLTLLRTLRDDEGADLGRPAPGGRPAVIRLRPGRCVGTPGPAAFLDHALLQLGDLLDPAFGHAPGDLAAILPHRRRLAQARYRLAWAASVDGRLERAGRAPLHPEAEHRARFAGAFPGLNPAEVGRLFTAVRTAERPRHALLMAAATAGRHVAGRRPGAPCPLCGFPTHVWAGPADAGLREAIRRDAPAWDERDGLCARCLEAYQARAAG